MSRRLLLAGLLLLSSPLAVSCDAQVPEPPTGDWAHHGRTHDEQRYSPLTAIDESNVASLGLAWSFDLQTRGVEATPLVVDGVFYVSGPWSVVHALDARDGRLLWSFDPQVPRGRSRVVCYGVVNRGVAAHGGRIYLGTLDGRLIALNGRTGKVVWETLGSTRKSPGGALAHTALAAWSSRRPP